MNGEPKAYRKILHVSLRSNPGTCRAALDGGSTLSLGLSDCPDRVTLNILEGTIEGSHVDFSLGRRQCRQICRNTAYYYIRVGARRVPTVYRTSLKLERHTALTAIFTSEWPKAVNYS